MEDRPSQHAKLVGSQRWDDRWDLYMLSIDASGAEYMLTMKVSKGWMGVDGRVDRRVVVCGCLCYAYA